MVVDPKVEHRIVLGCAHEERRRLFATLVAARGLAGGKSGDEPLGKWPLLFARVGCRGLLDDGGTRQHVSRDREPLADDVAGPIDAERSCMGGRSSQRVHEVDLPLVASRVGSHQRCEHVSGRDALCQEIERAQAVERIDQRLRRQGADGAAREGTDGADGEEFARDGNAEASVLIARDDRPRHGSPLFHLPHRETPAVPARALTLVHAAAQAAWKVTAQRPLARRMRL